MSSRRVAEIDLYKGLLLAYMVAAHTVYFVFEGPAAAAASRTTFAIQATLGTAVVLPSFLFAFGYASYRAYLVPGRERVRARALGTWARIYFVYLAWSLVWLAVTGRRHADLGPSMRDMALGRTTPLFADFLLPYAGIALLLVVAPGLWRFVVTRTWAVLAVVALSCLSTFLPLPADASAGLAAWWPVENAADQFPVAAFLQVFVLGAVCSRYETFPLRPVLLAGLVMTGLAVGGWLIWSAPSRFPPALGFIWVAGLPIALLVRLAWWLQPRRFLEPVLAQFRAAGRSPLFYLLVSNLVLVLIDDVEWARRRTWWGAFSLGLWHFLFLRCLHVVLRVG